ncbi:MAG TPA: tRNA 2-selenouridine(34) synthase MnmH [Flavobacteriales bacterium]
MQGALEVRDFLAARTPVLDVRSPGEFRRGHLPGAINLPLFDDAERAVVGTLYKQEGRDAAMLEGLRIVGPKLAPMVEAARNHAPDGRIRVHCWRGGERSGSVAWLLGKAGFREVLTLRGGYKAFRHQVLQDLASPRRLRVLGGYTGSGKTETLQHLKALGSAVIDLEALASHKGSSFGALGQAPQPTTEHFENLLWEALRAIDPEHIIWVEDESRSIGRVMLPQPFFEQMRQAPLLFADVPSTERVPLLVRLYGDHPREDLAEALHRIEKRMGPQHCKAALEALERNDLHTVASLTLHYYDRAYDHGLSKRDARNIRTLPATVHDLPDLARRLIEHEQQHT